MVTQEIKLGPQETKLLFTLEERGSSIFTITDAKKILNTSDDSVWGVLNGLTRKRRIQRIEKGKYLLVPARAGLEGYWAEEAWAVVPHLIDVYYIGFWTAMNYWGMTEQIPRTIFIATTKRKRDIEFGMQRFRFITLSEKKFFGYIKEKRDKSEFNISTREKTIVDGLMHPEYCGGISEVAKAIWNANKKTDWRAILEIAEKIGMSVILRRLGYLLALLRIQKDIANRIKARGFGGYDFLDPSGEKKRFGYSKEFGLILNATPEEITDWMGH